MKKAPGARKGPASPARATWARNVGSVLCAALTLAGRARADVEAVELEVRSGSACVDEASFVAIVRARTDRFRPAESSEGHRRFRVGVSGGRGAYTATLEIDGADGPSTRRTIHGATCEAVAAALATMVALAIDPAGEGAPAPAPESVPTAAPTPAPAPTTARESAPSATPTPAPTPTTDPESVPTPIPSPTVAPKSTPASPPEPGPATAPLHPPRPVSLGAVALSVFGPAHGAGFGGGAFVDLRWRPQGLFRPSLSLGAAVVGERPSFGDAIGADLTWYLARVEFCPARAGLGARLEVAPCAAVDGGALHASGIGVAPVATDLRAWAAPGMAGKLAWRIAERLRTDLTASLLFPLDAYRFDVLRPGASQPVEVHEMAPFEVTLALGLSFEP
ncbi:MAG TPA: hypothetical protein VK762_17870 [Polyangiaceae bacterium]|nr:hypothetical protein [Polyangiaceae bacterium]